MENFNTKSSYGLFTVMSSVHVCPLFYMALWCHKFIVTSYWGITLWNFHHKTYLECWCLDVKIASNITSYQLNTLFLWSERPRIEGSVSWTLIMMLKYTTINILIVCQSRYPLVKVRPNLGPNISGTKHDRDKLICSAERGGQCC